MSKRPDRKERGWSLTTYIIPTNKNCRAGATVARPTILNPAVLTAMAWNRPSIALCHEDPDQLNLRRRNERTIQLTTPGVRAMI